MNPDVMKSINKFCPNSGKPVKPDSLTDYKGFIVGFCNPGCRDTFALDSDVPSVAKNYFDVLIKESGLGCSDKND